MDNIIRSCLQIKAICCISDALNFHVDMNGMYNFVNKSLKEIGRDITGPTIDGNNRKTKKIRWTKIRGSAPG